MPRGAGVPVRGGGYSETAGKQGGQSKESLKNSGQQSRFNELGNIFDKNHPDQNIVIDGQTIRQGGGASSYGTTKIFESQNLTDQQIHNYAQQLAGDTPLVEVKPGIYTAKLNNGTSITLRNVSTSQEQTGARWTIDIKGNPQLTKLAHKYGRQVEMKFR